MRVMKTSSLELLEKTQLPPAQARAILQAMELELASHSSGLASKADILDALHELGLKIEVLRGDTRTEIQTLRTEMQIFGGELRTEMKALGGELRTEMKTLSGALRTEMQTLGGELRTEMQTMSGALRTEDATLRGDLRTEIQAVRGELIREMKSTNRWNFAFWATQFAAILGVLKLVK